MISRFRLDWTRLWGVIAVALVIFASLMLPTKLEHMRTGHWFAEHFLDISRPRWLSVSAGGGHSLSARVWRPLRLCWRRCRL